MKTLALIPLLLSGCASVAVWDRVPLDAVPLTCAFATTGYPRSVVSSPAMHLQRTIGNHADAEGCYYLTPDGFHIVADPADPDIGHVLRHECKHYVKGDWHPPGSNGDESDLDRYAGCADSLLKTGRWVP